MIEQQLKKLQNVSVNEMVKNQDWEKILEKEKLQPKFYWKEIVAIVVILTLAFTLFFIPNNPTENHAKNPFASITTIYYSNYTIGDNQLKSNYYPFVQKFEGETLDIINEKIKHSSWQKVERTLEGDYVTYKFVYADGSSKVLQNYFEEPVEYLYEQETGYAYVIQTNTFSDTVVFEMMKVHGELDTKENKRILYLLLLLIPIGSMLLINNHRYKKETGIQKLPKRYVNKWQHLSQGAIILLLIIPTILWHNVHYSWWLLWLPLSVLIFNLLDDRTEHYKWRLTNDLLIKLIALSIVTTLVYYLV